MFSNIYMHLHPRHDVGDYRPSRESLGVLRHLASSGPLTVSEAAKHFNRSQSTMSEIIERLIDRELLVKLPDEADRRRHLVWLSAEGERAVVALSQPLDAERATAAVEQMSDSGRLALLTGMRELMSIISTGAKRARRHRK